MLVKILINIIAIIISVIMVNKIYKEYKKSETIDEKVIFIIIVMVFLIPTIIYYADRFNIMSNLGLFENSESGRWFSFIENYISALISAVIGAVALILMTKKQLNLEREKNQFDKRVENAPILKYEINNKIVVTEFECVIDNNIEGNLYGLTLELENIGLNHAKNIELEINDGISDKNQKYRFDTQSFLKKNETKYVMIYFNYKYDSKRTKNNNKEIQITVYYQDLLNNNYIQNIRVFVEVHSNMNELYIVSKTIENELLCKEEINK